MQVHRALVIRGKRGEQITIEYYYYYQIRIYHYDIILLM